MLFGEFLRRPISYAKPRLRLIISKYPNTKEKSVATPIPIS